MKRLIAAACLALTPVSAWAEHGTQLTEWSSSSPAAAPTQTPEATPAQAPAAPAAPEATPAPVATAEKKDTAAGPATITATTTPDQLAAISGLSIQTSLDHYLGQATFLDANLYASLQAALDLSARYSFKLGGVKMAVSGRGYLAYEYSMPDAPNGRRVTWRDLSFGVSAPAIYKESFTGISVTPSLSFTVPITLESWTATTITVLGAGLNFTRTVGPFHLALSVSGSRGFHRNPLIANVAKNDLDASGVKMLIARNGESYAGVVGTNSAWGLGGGLGVTWVATDALSFDVSYALRTSWKYDIVPTNDEFTPQAIGADGQPVANVGSARGMDLSITSVSVNYQLSDHFAVSLFIYTAQKPKSDDNKNFRFPFWAFDRSASNNYSSLGLSLQASF